MRTVCLIAKGPNAIHAEAYRNSGDAIATVNDSGRYISGPIGYAFASDGVLRFGHHQDRIARIVTPVKSFDLPDWYTAHRHVMYADSACEGDEAAFRKRIAEGGICHHHTTTGAMHWLAKVACFDRIKIIGVDGGTEYATDALINLPAHSHLIATLGPNFLDDWKVITERLAEILAEVYGTQFEWYKND